VQCMHVGLAQPTATSQRVQVANQPIVTQVHAYAITGCALTGTPNPPCATAQWAVAATRVQSDGAFVLLKNSEAKCVPTGTGLNILVTQPRVEGA
jgi:hypothetical protein